MTISFKSKMYETPALTLTLSPEERGQPADILGCSSAHSANPASQFARRRNAIHPLLGERAGVREVVKPFFAILLTVAFYLVAALGVHAQSYSIDWHKIAGGGGTSTNGEFAVTGTIGQPESGGAMTGGGYSLTGGFWSLYAVQTTGAPLLTITQIGNQAVVSWPPSATGWTLQTNANLATQSWGNYLGPVVNNSVTNAPPKGNVFFRLKQ
jgi:hypothetical protein